jgi:hypothetical protein
MPADCPPVATRPDVSAGDPLPPDQLTAAERERLLAALWGVYRKSGSAVRLGHALKSNWPTADSRAQAAPPARAGETPAPPARAIPERPTPPPVTRLRDGALPDDR